MASVKPVIHGRDHRTGGADPIYPEGEGIRYNFDNVGDWLDVRTTTVGPLSVGIYLHADVGSILTDGLTLASDGIIKIASNHVTVGTDAELDVTPTLLTVMGGNQTVYPRRVDFQLGNTTTNPQGSKVVVYDSNGVSVFEVRDDGSVHIKTGTAPVADL